MRLTKKVERAFMDGYFRAAGYTGKDLERQMATYGDGAWAANVRAGLRAALKAVIS